MAYVKNVDEFQEYRQILEKVNNGLFDIPGFHKVSVQLRDDEFEIQTSNSDIFWLTLDSVKKYANEIQKQPGFLSYITRIYQEAILSRVSSELLKKIVTIVKASPLSIFGVKEGTLLNNAYNDLLYLGATESDAYAIAASIEKIYLENEEDNFSPEGKVLFVEYLNSILERIGTTIYVVLEYLDKSDLVIDPIQLGNIDRVMENEDTEKPDAEDTIDEGEATKVGAVNIELGASIYSTYADYQKDLEMIYKITDAAIHGAGKSVGVLKDYYTDRKPNATSIYVAIDVKDTPLKVVAILSRVEQKKIFGYDDTFVFSVESEDGFIDPKYSELKNEEEIANAIKELLK